ncbi:MAG: TetR/AcrR family transcriptional regulator, partial [Patulibacter sp.]
ASTDLASTRDRLLLAAADLLEAAQGGEVSTRAICDAAGVQAPTLYHHFGSKQELLDAVVTHGFKAFLADRGTALAEDDGDPIDDVQRGWDLHVRFGIENPAFYVRVYGRAVPGQPCGVVAEVEAMILKTLEPAARQGRLRVAPQHAARQILAASTGVVLTLISSADGGADRDLSDAVRDAVLARIVAEVDGRRSSDASADSPAGTSTATSAIALRAALGDDPGPLSATEAAMLDEWLVRLGG